MASHARKSKITGMSLQEILNMDEADFKKLNEKQLRPIVKQLGMAANRRISALERAGEKSPAYRGVMNWGGKFSEKGKNLNQLRSEASRELAFLKHKTSTLKGWQKVKSETIDTIEKFGFTLTKEEWDDFWESYEKLAEGDPSVRLESFKYDIFKEIHSAMKDKSKSPEEIAEGLKGEVSKTYERNKQLEQQRKSGGVSQHFKRR